MSEMVNAVVKAIDVALHEEFGEGSEIYMEEIEQDMDKPCFLISCLNVTYTPFPGKRYFKSNRFCIRYFPATRDKKRECNDVAEQMWRCLEYVTVDGEDKPIRGTKMKYEMVDGVLNFLVNYDRFVYKTEVQTPMEDLRANTDVKEGE